MTRKNPEKPQLIEDEALDAASGGRGKPPPPPPPPTPAWPQKVEIGALKAGGSEP